MKYFWIVECWMAPGRHQKLIWGHFRRTTKEGNVGYWAVCKQRGLGMQGLAARLEKHHADCSKNQQGTSSGSSDRKRILDMTLSCALQVKSIIKSWKAFSMLLTRHSNEWSTKFSKNYLKSCAPVIHPQTATDWPANFLKKCTITAKRKRKRNYQEKK